MKKYGGLVSHGGSGGIKLISVGKQESRAKSPGGCVHNAVLFPKRKHQLKRAVPGTSMEERE